MRLAVLALALLSLGVTASTAPASPRGLDLGFLDGTFSSSDPVQRASWFDDARNSGAEVVRIDLAWSVAAPSQPANAVDPNDPAYRWAYSDAAVRDAAVRGLRVVLSIGSAPAWAEGAHRPLGAPRGSWKPRQTALGQFAAAAARRYPDVTRWQIWNEPNINIYLTPQWTRRHGRWVPTAATHYRRMLNAAYTQIKRVNRRNVVISAGNAPYGDPPGGTRTRPVTFWRQVFKARTSFDIFAHHPYSVNGPRVHALNRNDISLPDLGRLTRLVRSAVRRGRVVPRTTKRVWITEIGWDSNPPDPNGVPERRRARWLADAFYVLWKQGADTVVWTFVRDQDATRGFDVTYQSGLFLRSGEPKLAQRAFVFPVSCERISGGKLRVWGKAPAAGPVEIVRGAKTVRSLTAGPRRVFLTTVTGRSGVQVKAGNQTSLRCAP